MEKDKSTKVTGLTAWIIKDKKNVAISYVVWCFVYKIIDMNTMQWFGKGIFITEGGVLGFFFMAVIAFFIIAWAVLGIYDLLTVGEWK
jgi:hypothetical protein|tara:strand:+ start:202 stop:465 length:264 start_codon:yes stop_codon:yes gene_type:complete